jgi:hypothetical protein
MTMSLIQDSVMLTYLLNNVHCQCTGVFAPRLKDKLTNPLAWLVEVTRIGIFTHYARFGCG